MSFLIPHLVLLFVGIAVFYLIMDIALALGDGNMPWWLKYVVAVVIFVILGGIEVFVGDLYQ
ncbi:MAG: hypothetical protein KBD24_04370 [Candidatus Pacebacteria bacterium]|nr:hypothetical protein [Candidatus Paceibacterota bacterium]